MTYTTFTAKKITRTRVGTRNGGTLHQSGRLNQLLKEFEQHRLALLGIIEVHWTGSGEMTSDGKKILYSCNDKKHLLGWTGPCETSNTRFGWMEANLRLDHHGPFCIGPYPDNSHSGLRTN